jgi:hypothetical protein
MEKYIEKATEVLDGFSYFLHAEFAHGGFLYAYFFRTTNTHILFYIIKMNATMTEKSITCSPSPLQYQNEQMQFHSPSCWKAFKKYKSFIHDSTKHRKENCDIFEQHLIIRFNGRIQGLACPSCCVPLEFEFTPNINTKSVEIWNLWASESFYVYWITEEVLVDILLLLERDYRF